MKKWDKITPLMSSAKLMINYRRELWEEVKLHPEWSVTRVNKYMHLISALNKRIARRSYDPAKIRALIIEVKRYSRNYKRVAKKLKISKRAVKKIIQQTKQQQNGKN